MPAQSAAEGASAGLLRRKCLLQTLHDTRLRTDQEVKCFCLKGDEVVKHSHDAGDAFIIEGSAPFFRGGSKVTLLSPSGKFALVANVSGELTLAQSGPSVALSTFVMELGTAPGTKSFRLIGNEGFLMAEAPPSVQLATSRQPVDACNFTVSDIPVRSWHCGAYQC